MKKLVLTLSIVLVSIFFVMTYAATQTETKPESQEQIKLLAARMITPTTIKIECSDHREMWIDFYGNNIFRLFQDNSGKGLRAPQAEPPAEILVKNPRQPVADLEVDETGNQIIIKTPALQLTFDKNQTTFDLMNIKTGKTIVRSVAPIAYETSKTKIELSNEPEEYFYGGGVQNGRFSHKGRVIAIEN